MDVNSTDARREVELANRLLRDREIDHAREIDNLRDSQREQIDSLTTSQQEALAKVRKHADEEITTTRDRFDKEMRRSTDTFEKNLNDERAEGYDRYGRMASENARDRAKTQELNTRRLHQILEGAEEDKRLSEAEHERRQAKLSSDYKTALSGVQSSYEKKLAGKDDGMGELRRSMQASEREHAAELTKASANDLAQHKQDADARYKKLLEDSTGERSRLERSFAQREGQMKEDAGQMRHELNQAHQKAFDEYRDRSHAELNHTIEDNNRKAVAQSRQNEAAQTQLRQQSDTEKQRLRTEFKSREKDLVAQNQVDRDRAALQEQISEKRHRSELNLNSDAVNENAKLNADDMKTRYLENLHDIDEKHRRAYEAHEADAQNKMFEQSTLTTNDRAELEHEKSQALAHSAVERAREKSALVRAYEERQQSSDDLNARQMAAQQSASKADMKSVREQASKQVETNNRSNQARLYESQQNLRTRTDELELQRKLELTDAETRYRDRTKRVTEAYNRNLVANKEAFDEEATVFKHEATMQMAKTRGDAEHEKRIAMLDLLSKNRAQMATLEAKLNEMKDGHEAELAKVKSDNDKLIRENNRRTRELLETERAQHGRELESKDLATKEKLRLQEEAFKEQIEKLKRSHELALKKS